eukprot:gnl/TRDRNA2_/TRDRNA2_146880_c0_seq1.p1 gnl/TRDRNA2_/TRDRNA2_146880_c0~~gnl/TRDRNA2_/TRDRNA2_146880_c0_seq1.p1  ORF type:complete len:411 (-),score=78.91 gnl/TRDRNA2_/TRDRNA2_146880_c0_seq1:143-1375(-)
MAFFGKKPVRGGGSGSLVSSSRKSTSSTAARGESDGFRRMKEEMEERERFAKEFEEGEKQRLRDEEERQRLRDEQEREEKQSCQEEPTALGVSGECRPLPNPRVFLEVEVKGVEVLGRPGRGVEASGRLEFELFRNSVPRTVENFRCLCTGEKGDDLTFEQSVFHRIIPGFMVQGGDITNGDGTGGRSIYGREFADEGFWSRHDARGLLSMANSGPNTNNSQFFITLKPAPHLDKKHVVFGRLLQESPPELLKRIEEKGSKSGDVKGVVRVIKCGEVAAQPTVPEAGGSKRSGSRSRSPTRIEKLQAELDRARSAEITTLRVSRFPLGTEKDDIVSLLSAFGVVRDVGVNKTPSPWGDFSAFVNFASHASARQAFDAIYGKQLQVGGSTLTAQWAKGNSKNLRSTDNWIA